MKKAIKTLCVLLFFIVTIYVGVMLFSQSTSPKLFVQSILASADITVNGDQPWDIQVHNEDLYARVLAEGSLGLGQAYMEGWWDSQELDQFFYRVLRAKLDQKIQKNLGTLLSFLKAKVMNLQAGSRAFHVGQQHYDLGDTLFEQMLDKNMIYSCGYWCHASTVDQAQVDKLELICKKLQLKPGMKLLDIGCGWGGLAEYAAKHYGVSVIGVTVSKEQASYAQEVCKGLPVEIRLQDYRDLDEPFDRIVSVGMFEHVGSKNYRTYFEVAHRCLADDGLFLLHTIGSNATTFVPDEWITKYIFPNSMLPSLQQVGAALEGLFIVEDLHNFGADYDKTLMAWFNNFERSWPQLKSMYDEGFYRMWRYYLLSCAGLFRARAAQLWQMVLSKNGLLRGYASVR